MPRTAAAQATPAPVPENKQAPIWSEPVLSESAGLRCSFERIGQRELRYGRVGIEQIFVEVTVESRDKARAF
jgi:hypothetical protein